MHHLPSELVDVIVKQYLPDPDKHCDLVSPHKNPNKTRAVNSYFRARNHPKRNLVCEREIFHYSKTPVRCRVHTDDTLLESLRTVDSGAAVAIEELRRNHNNAPGHTPYVAYIHILDKDLKVLGYRWYRHLALPSDIVVSKTCCDGLGVSIELI